MNKLRVQCSGSALVTAALLILLLPFKWLLAMLIAAIWHELCHYAAVRFCGGQILGISVSGKAAVMQAQFLPPEKQIICSLAGPVGGFVLLAAVKWLPRTAVCAAVHSLYNLLPVYPLDGGRALRSLLSIVRPNRKTERFCHWCAVAAKGLNVLFSAWLAFGLKQGMMPLLLAAALLIRTKSEKSLAN